MSSNAADEANGNGTSRDLHVWSLINSRSLDSASPNVALDHRVLRVGRYGTPPKSNQRPGDFPLGQCLNDTTITIAPGVVGCWQAIVGPPRARPRRGRVTPLTPRDTPISRLRP